MKFDQRVVNSLFTECIPCLLQTWTLSSNHALYSLNCRRLSSKYILYTGCTPSSLFFLLDIVLVPCSVFHITEGYLLVFYLYAGCIPCSLYFCWSLSSDHVVYSTLQRDIIYHLVFSPCLVGILFLEWILLFWNALILPSFFCPL